MALLAYLILRRGRALTRDALADLLWGDRDLKAARRVFRQALYVIRKGLGPDAVESHGELVRFQGRISVDAWDFEEALRGGDAERALELYGGPFLQGLEIVGAPGFQDWVDRERDRLRRMFREAVCASVRQSMAEGRWDLALERLGSYLQHDTSDAELLSLQARALHAAGRGLEARVAARGALAADEAREVLDDATRSALARLGAHDGGADTPPETARSKAGDAAVTLGLRAPVLTGRADEYRVLWSQWRTCVTGEGRVVLVVGDPGIGKSRLIDEMILAAETDEATVLRGKSYELEDGLLFGALVDVMGQAVRAPGFAAISDVWLAELARLLPELLEQYPCLQAAAGADELGGRRRFHEAVAQVFEALAYEAPVVCVLDDLHWADDATLELVHYLARRLCAVPVLLVAGLRPREASETLRRLQETLVEEHGGVSVHLDRLSREAVAELVASMAGGHVPPPSLHEAVWEASGGNPLMAVSTVRALVEDGIMSVEADGWRRSPGESWIDLPPAWELIRRRLDDLPARTREVLELAAVAGRRFTPDLLAGPAGEDLASLEVHLTALATRRLLRADRSDGVLCYDFAHDRLRQAVYEGIAVERRGEIHARVARGLAGDKGLSACLMARHFHEAGERDEAYRHALTGAAWARGVFAYGGELEMLDVALANAPDPEAARGVEERLGRLRHAMGAEGGEGHPLVRNGSGSPAARAWLGAAAVVAAVALGTWILRPGPGAADGLAAPEPLPPGLLVAIRDEDGVRHAILDPSSPGRRPRPLLRAEYNPALQAGVGALVVSPDGEHVAFSLADGSPPDVWVQDRDGSGLRQLTTDPEDDVPAAWLPDGSGLLIRTMRGRAGAAYGYGLAVAPLDGGEVRMITRGPWSDRAAAISPDGTRIAVVREFGGASLWLMDMDGSDGRPIMEGLGEVTAVSWAPDGRALALVKNGDAGLSLHLVDLTDARPSSSVLVEGVDGGPLWSPDGRWVYFTVRADNNREVFQVPVDGGDPVRLTYSPSDEYLIGYAGVELAYVESVEIIRGRGGGGLGLLEGDSVAVPAVAWSSAGGIHERFLPTLRCEDADVCRVTPTGYVVGTAPGETRLIADAGGWRADTLTVGVVDGTPECVLVEDWEEGIDPDVWRSFGEPLPRLEDRLGREGSRGFNPNGDAKYSSGVVTRASFAWRGGLTVEFRARGGFDTPWPSHQGWEVTLLGEPPPPGDGDISLPAMFLSAEVGSGTPDRRPVLRFAGQILRESPAWDPGEWHAYRVRLLPDLRCQLWVDDELSVEEECGRPSGERVWLMVGGRATHAPVVVDELVVWEGVR